MRFTIQCDSGAADCSGAGLLSQDLWPRILEVARALRESLAVARSIGLVGTLTVFPTVTAQ